MHFIILYEGKSGKTTAGFKLMTCRSNVDALTNCATPFQTKLREKKSNIN